MVPTFPGSCTPSSSRYRPGSRACGASHRGRAQEKTTPWGVSMGLTAFITLSLTCTSRHPAGARETSASSVWSTVRTAAPHTAASRRSLGLSHRNSPVSSR